MARYIVIKIDETASCFFRCKKTMVCNKCRYFGRTKENLIDIFTNEVKGKITKEEAENIIDRVTI